MYTFMDKKKHKKLTEELKDLKEFTKDRLSLALGLLLTSVSLKENNFQNELYLYDDVLEGLTEELKDNGFKITYSTKLLLEQICTTVVRIARIRTMEANSDLQLIRLGDVQIDSSNGKMNYHSVHPITEYIKELENRIIYLLKQLELLPTQVREREKIYLIQKLKKKLIKIEDKDSSYESELVSESKREV